MAIDRILNTLASRLGMALFVAAILMIAAGGAAFVSIGLRQVQDGQSLFDVPRLREGFVTQSDINRLVHLSSSMAASDEITPEFVTQFRRAVDILFVREGSFGRIIEPDNPRELAVEAHLAIGRVLEVADAGLAAGFEDPRAFHHELYVAAEFARTRLSLFVDSYRNEQTEALRVQANTLFTLTRLIAVLVVTMTLISVSAILLLRREVVARTERERAEKRANYLARFDPMTGLPNKDVFDARVASEISDGHRFSILFLDMDDFKSINDSHGNLTGDAVLREVAQRLETLLKSYGGTIARLGSDEFAALVPTAEDARLHYYAAEILQTQKTPVVVEGLWLTAGFSLGVASSATVLEITGLDSESMIRAASYALVEAKSSGGNCLRMFDCEIEHRQTERRQLLHDIPLAIEHEEFFVVYQPKILLEDQTLYGFEALIRWRRGDTVVSPADFIPLAEESRMIIDLDLYVLKAACAQFSAWNKIAQNPLGVSVNLSALHFDGMDIVGQVESALNASGLEPGRLTLELTETVLVEDWTVVSAILAALRGLGVRLSLDDFGTGYSSLAYLRQIAADELKIDRSFVTEIENSEQTRFIFDAVIDIAKGLNMTIVVEGIETKAQAAIVRSFGCDQGQGYFYGAPMGADQAAALLGRDPQTSQSA